MIDQRWVIVIRSAGEYYCGGNRFSQQLSDVPTELRFKSKDFAERMAETWLPDPRSDWTVVPVTEKAE